MLKQVCLQISKLKREKLQAICYRQFTISPSPFGANKEAKFGRMMAKMMLREVGKSKAQKKSWYIRPSMSTSGEGTSRHTTDTSTVRHRPGVSKRSRQVAAVLYRYISHMVSSGEMHPMLADRSVDVTRVTITDDFDFVNISWMATGDAEDDTQIQHIMDTHAGKLRDMLTSLHLISKVPRINFIKDEAETNYQHVDELLRIADFGPDYVAQESLTSLGLQERSRLREIERNDRYNLGSETIHQSEIIDGSETIERSETNEQSETIEINEREVTELNGDVGERDVGFRDGLQTNLEFQTHHIYSKKDTSSKITTDAQNVNKFNETSENYKDLHEYVDIDNTSESVNNVHGTVNTLPEAVNNLPESVNNNLSTLNIGHKQDIYGINRKELLDKVSLSINKSKDRSFGRDPADNNQTVGPFGDVNLLKSVPRKIKKTKKRDAIDIEVSDELRGSLVRSREVVDEDVGEVDVDCDENK